VPELLVSPPDTLAATRAQLLRQVAHWTEAAKRLGDLDDLASPQAWSGLERYLGVTVRQHLTGVVERLLRYATLLSATLTAAESPAQLQQVQRSLLDFKRRYEKAEVTLDFFADAINTRTNSGIAGILRACDSLVHRSMSQVLDPLGKPTPVPLVFLDKGLGASILKAGLRLWDGGGENPAAVIKIVRHNFLRPTALIHEAGHQVAHIVGWNEELAAALERGLSGTSFSLAESWASWSSEIAADVLAFVHTGYGSVAALHDVVAGESSHVLRAVPGDPHPVPFLRVLLGVEMCRLCWGDGPWDGLAESWRSQHDIEGAAPETAELIRASLPLMPKIAAITLQHPLRGFGNRPPIALLNPDRVSPATLEALEARLGEALYTSNHWVWNECVRLLGLSSLRMATRPDRLVETLRRQQSWMLRLGGVAETNLAIERR
jgi:hypothetical protein